MAYSAKREYDRAIADHSVGDPAFNPKDAWAYYNRGNAYRAKSDYDRAIADYTKAVSLKADYGLAY